MKTFITTFTVSVFLAASFIATAVAQTIKTGEWRMTMVTKMDGEMEGKMAEAMKAMEDMTPEQKAMMEQMMGGMGMKMDEKGITVTTNQCITDENPIPEVEDNQNCTTTHSVNGNTVNFEVTCPEGISTGEVTYGDDTMKGVIHTTTPEGDVTVNISGQYLGPCEK